MERLTKTYSDGSFGTADNLPCGENSWDFKKLLIDTLGAYESAEEQDLLVQCNPEPLTVEQLEYTIDGIMHSVDKWLDGEELQNPPETRAMLMREKTLQIVENLQSEIEQLKKNQPILCKECKYWYESTCTVYRIFTFEDSFCNKGTREVSNEAD